MGKGIIRITPELLLEHLLLLDGYKLTGATRTEIHLELEVEHESIPNIEGQPLPIVIPRYKKVDYELQQPVAIFQKSHRT